MKCCVPSCDWLCYLFGPQEAVVHHNVFKTSSLLIEMYYVYFMSKKTHPERNIILFVPFTKHPADPMSEKMNESLVGIFCFCHKHGKKHSQAALLPPMSDLSSVPVCDPSSTCLSSGLSHLHTELSTCRAHGPKQQKTHVLP